MEELEARYFDALYEAAKAINSSLKVEEVLSTIVRATAMATEAKGCSLLLLDDERKHLVHKADFGLSDKYLHKGELIANRSIADTLRGETVIVSDASNDPRVQYPAEKVKEGIVSIISLPLAARDVVIGELRVYFSHKQDAFPRDMIRLLTAVANLSAIAIENSGMYESLKKAHDVCQRELWHLQP
jgi:GAF domain-containing protein